MLPWFKDWFNSPYYHQLYFNRDDKEAADFIDKLIIHLNPAKDSFMLDVACGKGRHSLQLAEGGFDVTGIDLSEDSIKEALQYESNNLHFYQHDMRLPCWINYFDYAFNFFTSFGYFNTQRENDNAIRTISQSLKYGGKLVMDYLNVQYAEERMDHESEKEIDNVKFQITKWYDEDYFYKKISIEDEKLPQTLVFTEKVAKFNADSFKKMFSAHELVIKEVFGDYNFQKYDVKKSPRLIMVAEKIKNG